MDERLALFLVGLQRSARIERDQKITPAGRRRAAERLEARNDPTASARAVLRRTAEEIE